MEEKKQKSKMKIFWLVLIILIVAVGSIIAWYFVRNGNPKLAFYNNLGKVEETTEALLSKILVNPTYNYTENKVVEAGFRLSGSIKSNKDNLYAEEIKQINDFLNGEEIYFKEQIDLNNNELYAYAELKENNKKALSGEVYINTDTIIMQLRDILSEKIYIDRENLPEDMKELNEIIDNLFSNSTLNSDNSELYEIIVKVMKENIEDSQFAKITTTLDDVKCEKTTLKIPKEQPKQILIQILEELKNIELVKGIVKTEESEEYIYSINEMIDQLRNEQLDMAIDIDIFNKGSKVLKIDVKSTIFTIEDEITVNMSADFSKENRIDIIFNFGTEASQASYSVKLTIEIEDSRMKATLDFGSMLNMKVTLLSERINDVEEKIEIRVFRNKEAIVKLNIKNIYIKNSDSAIELESKIAFEIVTDEYYNETVSGKVNLGLEIANIDKVNKLEISNNSTNILKDEIEEKELMKLQESVMNTKIYNKIMEPYVNIINRAEEASKSTKKAQEEEQQRLDEMNSYLLQNYNFGQ